MHFKIVVLFCALNFLTTTRSFGLHQSHIKGLVNLFVTTNDVNNENYYDMIDEYFIFWAGITDDVQVHALKKTLDDDITMTEFLILLAYNKKELFTWMEISLSTYEVELFVRMFNAQDTLGESDALLTQDEFNDLIDNGFNLKADVKELIKNEYKGENTIHVLQFLAAMLKYKKMGKGLNNAQLNKCYALYTNSSNGFLDSHKRRKLLETLNIVSDEYVELLDFKNVYPAAQELKVLLVLWSEYNEDVDVTSDSVSFLTTEEVWLGICDFTQYDDNGDGLLSSLEFYYFATDFFSESEAYILKTIIETFNPYEHPMCAARFLSMKLLKKHMQTQKH
ncbi:uncharacterized protein LOC126846826 [Adelges cooleyi]|uniref:uncharacterized protein LOC126846826 n=1 Tax=Adelges cooleyi TaxID=133065 RepID=UPI00217FBA41|nr:uncharacterized protein LOC126846826 [Adelges cooleyi]